MTFNEFLIKKKIDFSQFNKAEPELFSEFEVHFSQMGEKSFDHSKKFWFNKLRRRFHLAEVPKATKESIEVNELAAQAEPLISPTITASGVSGSTLAEAAGTPAAGEESSKPAYKPRFKAPTVNKNSGDQSTVSDKEEPKDIPSESPATTAYKPRFKAPIKEKPADVPQPDLITPDPEEPKPKPVYKPRFNPATQNSTKNAEIKEEEKEPIAKPAYIPRFRAPNLAPKTELSNEANEEVKPEPTAENKPENPGESAPKPAYKPRFRPGITKPKDTD